MKYFISKEEKRAYDSLCDLTHEDAKNVILTYIIEKRLYTSYIEAINELMKDYIEKANSFIVQFKQDVNVLYLENNLGHNIFKNVDINSKNWFWYARLLRDSEDEVYPKCNFLQPTYLLGRLKPIIANIDVERIKNRSDDELYKLYKICLDLMSKYGIQDCDCNKEVKKEDE